jgi:hypothetical protein
MDNLGRNLPRLCSVAMFAPGQKKEYFASSERVISLENERSVCSHCQADRLPEMKTSLQAGTQPKEPCHGRTFGGHVSKEGHLRHGYDELGKVRTRVGKSCEDHDTHCIRPRGKAWSTQRAVYVIPIYGGLHEALRTPMWCEVKAVVHRIKFMSS